MSRNFEALKRIDRLLAEEGSRAEEYLRADVNASLLYFRRFGHRMAKLVAPRKGIELIPFEDFNDLLKRLEQHLDDSIFDDFKTVKNRGNVGVHDDVATKADAEEAMQSALRLATWFYDEYNRRPSALSTKKIAFAVAFCAALFLVVLSMNRQAPRDIKTTDKPAELTYGDLYVSVENRLSGPPVAIGRYRGQPAFSIALDDQSIVATPSNVNLRIIRLDPTTTLPQLVLTYYSGGAHCCTITKIATIDPSERWHVVDGDVLDGELGYRFQDLDGDGTHKLISFDNSFLYRFSSYGGSYAPTLIKSFWNSSLLDVSRQPRYQTFLHVEIGQMEERAQKNGVLEINGYLGGWVAAKAMVGELADAWRRMLVSYDPNSRWVIEECLSGEQIQQCPVSNKRRLSFPAALAKHLVQRSYVTHDDMRRISNLQL